MSFIKRCKYLQYSKFISAFLLAIFGFFVIYTICKCIFTVFFSTLGSEKSLKKSFDLFDEYLDVRIHNKFFRMIGVSDNHIRMAEGGSAAGDKVYELLKNWMQRQGLKADINDLLGALLSMDQRRSAEDIASAALRRGYYKHADTP